MTLRHISPRSVEWYEATLEDGDDPLSAEEVLALRTMKALEDTEIRAALARPPRVPAAGAEGTLAFRLPPLQARVM
jgi:hypothetical protein